MTETVEPWRVVAPDETPEERAARIRRAWAAPSLDWLDVLIALRTLTFGNACAASSGPARFPRLRKYRMRFWTAAMERLDRRAESAARKIHDARPADRPDLRKRGFWF